MKTHKLGISLIISALFLGGCDEMKGMKLIGSENCIICIRDSSTHARKAQATTAASEDTADLSVADEEGNGNIKEIQSIPSRYGKFDILIREDDYKVLLFNGKRIVEPDNPPGYKDLIASPYGGEGVFPIFDKNQPVKIGEYDVYPIYVVDGGNVIRLYTYLIIAIGPDKQPIVYGNNRMLSRDASYKVENGKFIAEYDGAIVTFANNRFVQQDKPMQQIPNDICQEMFETRKAIANDIQKKQDGGGAVFVAKRYAAFSTDKMYRAGKQKKITFNNFKKQVCQ
ncbi:MAG: hypothetical protein Q4A74_02940 [Cardiobacteriaceae bacterium]|nr:hypothetical protein [Cardiobacteriaceae bacterium]